MSDYITHDVLSLFLKLLPVKSLLRCRGVCKPWKQLIDSTPFTLLHLSLQTPRLLAQNRDLKYLFFNPQTLPFFNTLNGPVKPQKHHIEHSPNDFMPIKTYHLAVVGTAHGVICLFDNETLLLLWNLSIRRLLRLPRPDVSPTPVDWFSSMTPDYHSTGFWIDPCTRHFKVVVFYYKYNKIALFSSRKRAWKEVAILSNRIKDNISAWSGHPMILVGGVGYFQMYDLSVIGPGVVASFDFEKDKFGTIEFPKLEEVEGVKYRDRLIKWKDCVSLVHWQVLDPHGCDLWAMRNGSWSKMFSFNVVEGTTSVVHVAEDCGRVLANCGDSETLVLHDPNDGRVCLKLKFALSGYVVWAYDFVESLVFPAPMKFL